MTGREVLKNTTGEPKRDESRWVKPLPTKEAKEEEREEAKWNKKKLKQSRAQ